MAKRAMDFFDIQKFARLVAKAGKKAADSLMELLTLGLGKADELVRDVPEEPNEGRRECE